MNTVYYVAVWCISLTVAYGVGYLVGRNAEDEESIEEDLTDED